ncbi:hypothetical protein [Streptomyces sp. NPDC086989]|uniref:hypothetical protein n=1 Tax=Streptomyces sp. NPDC086989 TaxID=3365764 RepID=UPI003826B87D
MATVQPPLFLPGWDIEPCDTTPASARWIRVSRIDPEEAAFLELHGYPVPRTTITFHAPELCCDRDKFH